MMALLLPCGKSPLRDPRKYQGGFIRASGPSLPAGPPAGAWVKQETFEGAAGDEGLWPSYISTQQAYMGSHSMRYTLPAGQEGLNQFQFNLGSQLTEGNELWFRTYIYPPVGFDWSATPIVKLIRFATASSGGEPTGYNSVLATNPVQAPGYGCSGTDSWGYLVADTEYDSGESICPNQNLSTYGYLTPGQWHCVELYNFFHSTSGIIRMWHNGTLKKETVCSTLAPGGYCPQTQTVGGSYSIVNHLLGWWNGGASQTQDLFFDQIKFTNSNYYAASQDSAGNAMIGLAA